MSAPGVHRLPDGGWEIAIASDRAAAVTLELYAPGEYERPFHRQPLEPAPEELVPAGMAVLWRCRLSEELAARARCYAYRVEGEGGRFDLTKPLLDPYAREVVFPPGFSREAARVPGEETAGRAPLGVLPGREASRRREPPPPPGRGPEELVVYELHVDAFTRRDPGVLEERRGTFRGLVDKIPYLLELGVTAVELMPVFQWDPQEENYWGYMPMAFFAADRRFAPGGDPTAELASAVAELHRAGIEVWLDVVYNHTAEGDETGPTYSFRGLDDAGYYLADPADPHRYLNDSGTGNVFACARPAPRRLILDSLRYWAEEVGVAGFRFDLATLLARDAEGRPDPEPPLMREIERWAASSGRRLVAEPWDLAGYALGADFPGRGWWQWNDRFRDAMRAWALGFSSPGEGGLGREPIVRLAGSPDLFAADGLPVNYVSCHDGLNLHDLIAGHVGGDEDPIDGDLVRGAKNLFALLLLAAGVPMFLAGDEFLDTRLGDPNPYHRDDESNWLDGSRRERFAEVHRFVRRLIAFRRARPWLARAPWASERAAWYAPDGPHAAGESGPAGEASALACHLRSEADDAGPGGDELYLAVNPAVAPTTFDLPAGGGWRLALASALPAPADAPEPGAEPPHAAPALEVAPRSVTVLGR